MSFFATGFGAVDTNGTAGKQVYIYIFWGGLTCHYTTPGVSPHIPTTYSICSLDIKYGTQEYIFNQCGVNLSQKTTTLRPIYDALERGPRQPNNLINVEWSCHKRRRHSDPYTTPWREAPRQPNNRILTPYLGLAIGLLSRHI